MYTGLDTSRHAGTSRAEQAYTDLKHRLLVGDFPVNVRLVEERLAALAGVSRTPVREALARLHAEGLVERAPDGGFMPTIPDVAMMRHLYEVRAGLELQGLRLPAQRGEQHDLEMLEDLRDEWRAMRELAVDGEGEPEASFVLLDEAFHVGLAESAGNPPLADLLRQVNERIRVVRTQDFLSPGRITETIDEHLGLVEAVIGGDLAQAEAAFTTHLAGSVAVIEQRVSQAVARMLRIARP